MPKYYEDKEEDDRACAGVREDFKACLLQHDCVVKEGKKPSECLKEGHCKALQTSFFECKRSMVSEQEFTEDMRAGHEVTIQREERILRKPIAAGSRAG